MGLVSLCIGEQMANISPTQKAPKATLFPILPQPVGIARLAAEAEHADDGHLIEFKALNVRSILNKSTSKRLRWLAWSINPYRGCEFGCKYCYARYTHEFMELRDPLAFERLIFVKQHAAWLLEQELRKIDPADEIALGTATDPYQPIERRAQITRSLLEVFARRRGYHLGIVTKSTLIARDIDLLTEIARHNTLTVHLTITTPDTELARLLEPRAAPGPPLPGGPAASRSGDTDGNPLLPSAAGNHRYAEGAQRDGASSGGSRCELSRRQPSLPQAVLASHLSELRSRALSCAGGGLRGKVCPRGLCRAALSPEAGDHGRSCPPPAWPVAAAAG